MLDVQTLRVRFKELGVWRESENMPVFGWLPVLLGWLIELDNRQHPPAVRFNGRIWMGSTIKVEDYTV